MPRVSIGLPVFNGEQFLPAAIDSLLDQTYSDFELVISDNGSTDNTETICRDYAAKDPRVRYYRSNRNRGSVLAFCGPGLDVRSAAGLSLECRQNELIQREGFYG